jgi:MerR family mercuric resistance operon transcriptional regulator
MLQGLDFLNQEDVMRALSIGALAKQTGITVEAVRYYERVGLIPRPPRSTSGYRRYPETTLRRLKFIQHAKNVGFTLRDIRELLSLQASPDAGCADVRRQASRKLAEVEARIEALGEIRAALADLIKRCRGTGPTSECPIIDALESWENDTHAIR